MKAIVSLITAVAVLCLASVTVPAVAAPIDGRLSIETFSSADREKDQSTMLLGSLSTRLAKRWTLTGSAQYQLGDRGVSRSIVSAEDKVRGALYTGDVGLYKGCYFLSLETDFGASCSLMLKPGVGVCGAEFSWNVFLSETVR